MVVPSHFGLAAFTPDKYVEVADNYDFTSTDTQLLPILHLVFNGRQRSVSSG